MNYIIWDATRSTLHGVFGYWFDTMVMMMMMMMMMTVVYSLHRRPYLDVVCYVAIRAVSAEYWSLVSSENCPLVGYYWDKFCAEVSKTFARRFEVEEFFDKMRMSPSMNTKMERIASNRWLQVIQARHEFLPEWHTKFVCFFNFGLQSDVCSSKQFEKVVLLFPEVRREANFVDGGESEAKTIQQGHQQMDEMRIFVHNAMSLAMCVLSDSVNHRREALIQMWVAPIWKYCPDQSSLQRFCKEN